MDFNLVITEFYHYNQENNDYERSIFIKKGIVTQSNVNYLDYTYANFVIWGKL